MVQAYVFINISTRDPLEVLTALRQIPEVQEAHSLLGPVDCIAKLECPTQEKLQEVLSPFAGFLVWPKPIRAMSTREQLGRTQTTERPRRRARLYFVMQTL
jgi:DNA-binding Lrp family transcriptional regulator